MGLEASPCGWNPRAYTAHAMDLADSLGMDYGRDNACCEPYYAKHPRMEFRQTAKALCTAICSAVDDYLRQLADETATDDRPWGNLEVGDWARCEHVMGVVIHLGVEDATSDALTYNVTVLVSNKPTRFVVVPIADIFEARKQASYVKPTALRK
jgi:hypothetical protein